MGKSGTILSLACFVLLLIELGLFWEMKWVLRGEEGRGDLFVEKHAIT